MRYRRFGTAAEAIRFAIEELPPPLLAGASLRVEDERFDSDQIRELYQSAAYPLEPLAWLRGRCDVHVTVIDAACSRTWPPPVVPPRIELESAPAAQAPK